MKSKYKCPFCQYMSLKKWNIKKHVNNVHGIRNFPNGSIQRASLNQQNIRPEYVHLDFPNGSNEKMKGKYQCPYCQYMSLKKFNVERHVRNVHRIKDFSNGSNEKPNINQQKIIPTKFHTESDCPDEKSREILQKIGAEIALLLLKEYKVIKKPVVITSKGVSLLE